MFTEEKESKEQRNPLEQVKTNNERNTEKYHQARKHAWRLYNWLDGFTSGTMFTESKPGSVDDFQCFLPDLHGSLYFILFN